MADAVNDAELGRSKQSVSPADHLFHLLTIGWNPASPLIQRYVSEHSLSRELTQWRAIEAENAAKNPAKPTGKQK